MKPAAITVGIPVRDLDAAIEWYRAAFGLGEPDLRPIDGIAEFDLRLFWLQLIVAPDSAAASPTLRPNEILLRVVGST